VKVFHTAITDISECDLGIQVVVTHRFHAERAEASEARKRGQAKWVAERLYEQGRSVDGYKLTDVRTHLHQTQLSFQL